MNYYYLVASLTHLRMEDPPPVSTGAFRELCRHHLCPADIAALDALLDDTERTPAGHPYVAAWRNAVRQVRNATARLRASRLQRDPAPFLRTCDGFNVWTEHAVVEAFQRPNPLERQRALDRLAWERAGELAAGNPFSENVVFAYAVRLQIAERWAAMSDRTGAEVVNERLESGTAAS